MSKNSQLLKNTMIIAIGKICTQFVSFFLLPLYTSVLSTEQYGIVDLVITYVGLFVPCITLQLESATFRYLIEVRGDKEKIKKIFTNVIGMCVLFGIFFSAIYWIVIRIIGFSYSLMLFLCILGTIISNIFLQFARGIGNNIVYSEGCVIAGITNVLFNILFLLRFHMGPSGMLLSVAASNILCGIYIFIRIKIYDFIEIRQLDKAVCGKLLKYSIPLIPNTIIWWIINVSDRTIISFFLGTQANGIYAISNKFPSIIMSFYNVFNLSWTEAVSLNISTEDGKKFISNRVNDIIYFFGSIMIVLMGWMWIIFPIMIKSSFHEAYKYIPLLLLGSFFNVCVSIIGSIYVGLKKTKEIANTSFFAGIINIFINLVFIKFVGIYAAAISTIIAFFTMTVYRIYDIKKYFYIKISKSKMIALAITFLCVFIIYLINNVYMNILNSILSIGIMFYTNRNIISWIFNRIKSICAK